MISKGITKSPPRRHDVLRKAPVGGEPVGPKRSKWGWLRSLLRLVVLAGTAAGAYYAYRVVPWEAVTALLVTGGAKPPEAPPPRPVPVVAATTWQADMDLHLKGLGTVTALYTVTLRSRVDGELMTVAFTEGQIVKKGDLLAQIDPRPYEVQKKQYQGQLLKDKAARDINQLNLDRYVALLPNKTVTKQQVDEQVALVKQSEGAIETDEATIDNVESATDVLPDHRADHRPNRPAAGRSGQHGPCQRSDRSGGDHPACSRSPSSLPFRRTTSPGCSSGSTPATSSRSTPTIAISDQLGHRQADGDRQSGRRDDGHGAAESDVSEPGQHAVSQSVRQRPAAEWNASTTW